MSRYDHIVEINKFNPYHGVDGRFASAPGGRSISAEQFSSDRAKAKIYQYERSRDYFLKAVELYSKYQEGTADQSNFFIDTMAMFKETRRPKGPPDHVSYDREGKVSSEYWYSETGVVRGSNHWGTGVASCDWAIETKQGHVLYGGYGRANRTLKLYGKAEWSDFILKPNIANIEGIGYVVQTFNNRDGKYHMNINGKIYFGYQGKWTEVGKSTVRISDSYGMPLGEGTCGV